MGPFRFTTGGESFVLPARPSDSIIAAAAQGRHTEALQGLLGDDYDRFMATRPTSGAVVQMMNAYREHLEQARRKQRSN